VNVSKRHQGDGVRQRRLITVSGADAEFRLGGCLAAAQHARCGASSNAQHDQFNKSHANQQHRKRYGIIFEPMPIIGKHYVHPGLSKTVAGEPQGEDATVFLINTYRTPVSGVFRRKDSGFAVCAKTWLAFRSLWQESGIQVAVRFAKTSAS